jgi:hypothetical protein
MFLFNLTFDQKKYVFLNFLYLAFIELNAMP